LWQTECLLGTVFSLRVAARPQEKRLLPVAEKLKSNRKAGTVPTGFGSAIDLTVGMAGAKTPPMI